MTFGREALGRLMRGRAVASFVRLALRDGDPDALELLVRALDGGLAPARLDATGAELAGLAEHDAAFAARLSEVASESEALRSALDRWRRGGRCAESGLDRAADREIAARMRAAFGGSGALPLDALAADFAFAASRPAAAAELEDAVEEQPRDLFEAALPLVETLDAESRARLRDEVFAPLISESGDVVIAALERAAAGSAALRALLRETPRGDADDEVWRRVQDAATARPDEEGRA
ncbi:MAG: hypothetical protein R3F20_12810 [Planctomycetota bacterium]